MKKLLSAALCFVSTLVFGQNAYHGTFNGVTGNWFIPLQTTNCIYVNPSSTNSGVAGNPNTAYANINSAASNLLSGMTMILQPGYTYTLDANTSIELSNGCTLVAYGATVTEDPNGNSKFWMVRMQGDNRVYGGTYIANRTNFAIDVPIRIEIPGDSGSHYYGIFNTRIKGFTDCILENSTAPGSASIIDIQGNSFSTYVDTIRFQATGNNLITNKLANIIGNSFTLMGDINTGDTSTNINFSTSTEVTGVQPGRGVYNIIGNSFTYPSQTNTVQNVHCIEFNGLNGVAFRKSQTIVNLAGNSYFPGVAVNAPFLFQNIAAGTNILINVYDSSTSISNIDFTFAWVPQIQFMGDRGGRFISLTNFYNNASQVSAIGGQTTYYTTNATFAMGPLISPFSVSTNTGVSDMIGRLIVTNSSGVLIGIVPPVSCGNRTNGLGSAGTAVWNCTNVSFITIESFGGLWTNATCQPGW